MLATAQRTCVAIRRGVRDVVTTCRIIDAELTGIVDTTSRPIGPGPAVQGFYQTPIARNDCRAAGPVLSHDQPTGNGGRRAAVLWLVTDGRGNIRSAQR
jgi:hypothetical protein